MDSCAACGAELGEFQAFCPGCGSSGHYREVSLDALLDGQAPTPPALADLVAWSPPADEPDAAEEVEDEPEPSHEAVVQDEPDDAVDEAADEDWDVTVPAGVSLRLVPIRDAEVEPPEAIEHAEGFWYPEEVADLPDDAAPEEPVEPDDADPVDAAEPEPEPEASPVTTSGALAVPPLPVPPAVMPAPVTPEPVTVEPVTVESVMPAPYAEASVSDAASETSVSLDPWGVPISPVPLEDPSRPLFVDEAPLTDTGRRDALGNLAHPRPHHAPYAPYVPPRRSVPVSAVAAFVLAGVAGSAAIGLLAVPVANAETCNPAAPASAEPSSAAGAAEGAPGNSAEDLTAQLNAADLALSKAQTKATDTEQKLAAARTALETATAATRVGGVDQSALTAAEAEVTRAASALQAAQAAQRSAASQAAQQASAGDWELDMLRAAEKERDQFSKYDPADTYWDDEVASAKNAYEQALVPQRQAAAALATANASLATAQSKHTSAVSTRDQVSGRNAAAVARAEKERQKAEKKVARAEKAQAQAQSELVAARDQRNELEAGRRELEHSPTGTDGADPASTSASTSTSDCNEQTRGRRTAASITGGTSLALFAVGTGLTVRHRRTGF